MTRVALLSSEPIRPRMAGIGIRYFELARRRGVTVSAVADAESGRGNPVGVQLPALIINDVKPLFRDADHDRDIFRRPRRCGCDEQLKTDCDEFEFPVLDHGLNPAERFQCRLVITDF